MFGKNKRWGVNSSSATRGDPSHPLHHDLSICRQFALRAPWPGEQPSSHAPERPDQQLFQARRRSSRSVTTRASRVVASCVAPRHGQAKGPKVVTKKLWSDVASTAVVAK